MKKEQKLTLLLGSLVLALPACSLGMTQKNISSGLSYLNSILEKYNNVDTPEFVYSNAVFTLTIDEKIVSNDTSSKDSSFTLSASYFSNEEEKMTSIIALRENEEYSISNFSVRKQGDGTFVVLEEEERIADQGEDYYSYFDIPYIIETVVNRNSVRYLASNLNLVYETANQSSKEEETPPNVLTGYNISNIQKEGSWQFSLYSDYLSYPDIADKLGFSDSSYFRFFRYSGIEATKAYSMTYTFSGDTVDSFKALYQRVDDETGDIVSGTLAFNVTYGEKQ